MNDQEKLAFIQIGVAVIIPVIVIGFAVLISLAIF